MKSEKQLQIAVVTGASSGMGRETVIQLADRFALLDEIWVLARREDRLRDLERQVPVKLRIFAVDLLNLQELDPFQEELSRLKPNVRFLVNAAGFGKTGPVGQTSFFGKGSQGDPICFRRRLFAPAGFCRLRCLQGLCFKLQPGLKPGTETKEYQGYGSLSGAGKNRVFSGYGGRERFKRLSLL